MALEAQFGDLAFEELSHAAFEGDKLWVAGQVSRPQPGGAPNDAHVLLAEFSSDGALADRRELEGSGRDTIAELLAFPAGGLLLVVNRNDDLPTGSGTNLFVTRLEADGTPQFEVYLGSDGDDWAAGAAIGDDGIYIAGTTTGLIDEAASQSGGTDVFLLTLDLEGKLVDARQFGTSEADTAAGVVKLDGDRALVAGTTFGAWDGQDAKGGADIFVLDIDLVSGTVASAQQVGSPADDFATDITSTEDDEVWVSATTRGELGPGGSIAGPGDRDSVVLRLQEEALRPVAQFGSDAWDDALSLVPLCSGVAVAGVTEGSLGDFTQNGRGDAFVATISDSGEVRFSQRGTASADGAQGLAVSPNGELLVVGFSYGSLLGERAGESDAIVYSECAL